VNVNVDGCGPDYPDVTNHHVAAGRFFTEKEYKALDRVAVLGSEVSQELFDLRSPLGKYVTIARQPFLVIGVLKRMGGQGRDNPDNSVYVPVTTAMRRMFGMERIEAIVCQARSTDLMEAAEESVLALLKRRHEKGRGEPDFRVLNQASLAEARDEQQSTFASLITWLAVVSLVVGGIGIMNIMLVSVTERTREIGVRKAIGAKRSNILAQFLMEALLLSLLGGLFGTAAGILGSGMVAEANDWKIVLSLEAIILAFGCSVFVGISSGMYPAWKASRLNPIQALRYE
jgi:putative ABC transport system permease protein